MSTAQLTPIRTIDDFPIDGARIRWQHLAGHKVEWLQRLKQMTDRFGMRYAWESMKGIEQLFDWEGIRHLQTLAEQNGYDMQPLIDAYDLSFWEEYHRQAIAWNKRLYPGDIKRF